MSLAQRYQPLVFEDVIGQDAAVRTLSGLLHKEITSPVFLTGPAGAGKTTLAQIAARAINCAHRAASGSPCLSCPSCLEFDTEDSVFSFTYLNAGRFSGKEHAGYLDAIARMPATFGGRRVVFIDEVQAWTTSAAEQFLDIAEAPDAAVIFLASNQPERVNAALRSRSIHVRLSPISAAALVRLAQHVCKAETIPYEQRALEMLAAGANGGARDLLKRIEEVTATDRLTVDAVRRVLLLDWVGTALDALTALLRGDYVAAVDALADWEAPPPVKARALRDAFIHVGRVKFGWRTVADPGHAAFLGASEESTQALAAAVWQRASELSLGPVPALIEWAEHWGRTADMLHDDSDFALRLERFALMACRGAVLTGPLAAPPPVKTETLKRRAVTRRLAPAPKTPAAERARYLTKADVKAQARCATLLPQAYNCWFNVRLFLDYAVYDISAWREALDTFSSLKHKLTLNLRRWAGDGDFRLHWMVQHEVSPQGTPQSRWLMHVPPELREAAAAWIAGALPTLPDVLANTFSDIEWRAPDRSGCDLHWSLVRELWRALDPTLCVVAEDGRRQPLKKVLGVPPQEPRIAGVLPAGLRRHSPSDTLAPSVWRRAAQRHHGFVSAFDEGAYAALSRGWEAEEFQNRTAEEARRELAIGILEAALDADESEVHAAALHERMDEMIASWDVPPLLRPRATPLW